MDDAVTFRTADGRDPVEYLLALKRGIYATTSDAMQVSLAMSSRMLKRTSEGVDVHGRAFATYSREGPIYIYPNSAGNTGLAKRNRSASSSAFAKKTGATQSFQRGRIGLKFDSYEDWKQHGLGRKTVDLMGASGRMLQAVKVRVHGIELSPKESARGGDDRRATEFSVGIWDAHLATIGAAHNSGARTGRGHKVTLPQREWFGFNGDDLAFGNQLLIDLAIERLDNT